jgi:hypothetical protein
MSAESTGSVGIVLASCSEMPCWARYLTRALILSVSLTAPASSAIYAAPASTIRATPPIHDTQAAPSPAYPPIHGAIANTSPTTDMAQWSRVGSRAIRDHPPYINVMAPRPKVKPAPTALVCAHAGVTAVPRPSAIVVHPTAVLLRCNFFIFILFQRGVAALLTDDDPRFTALIRLLLVEHRAALAAVVEDATAAGQLRADLDIDTMLDCIVGAYLAERARSGNVQPGWAQRILRTLWPAVAASP